MGDSSYAPKSPDLSSLFSGSDIHPNSSTEIPPPANTHYHLHTASASGPAAAVAVAPQPHHYQPYQTSPSPHQRQQLLPTQQSVSSHPLLTEESYHSYSPQGHKQASYITAQYSQPPPQFFGLHHQQQQQQQPALHHQPAAPPSYYSSYTDSTAANNYHQFLPQPSPYTDASATATQPPPTPSGSESKSPYNNNMPPRKAPPPMKRPEIMESPVRTKFPTARIKRIMQADEEVGKVAQQTPIAVGKALELFMVQLVTRSAEVARERNSKRITAAMLKQTVESTTEWDFLQDIVAKVAEEKEGTKSSGKARAESDSDVPDEPVFAADVGEPKRKGRGGRKKKAPA
ncbi:hypothetical protein F4778DRAFT_560777 [Xylariomycetidae sp. FL2044]|nr:hypothetical protein F4778DRAFT_560777 [Xylariomycetidae sp. FL2044]